MSRELKPGDPITVSYGRGQVHPRVVWRHATYLISSWHQEPYIKLTPENEGVRWVRGHNGLAVDALRVTAALSP